MGLDYILTWIVSCGTILLIGIESNYDLGLVESCYNIMADQPIYLSIVIIGLLVYRYRSVLMPRKRKKPQETTPFVDHKSVWLDLSYVEEQDFLAELKDGKWGDFQKIPELIEYAWKLSITYSEAHSKYYVTASYKGVNYPELKNVSFISRHGDLEKAFALIQRFVHVEIEDRGNVDYTEAGNTDW